LKLALRGRIRIRADLIGFDESPSAYMMKNNQVVEDVLWYAARDVGKQVLAALDVDPITLATEITDYEKGKDLSDYPVLQSAVDYMRSINPWSKPVLVNDLETLIREHPEVVEPDVLSDYFDSAVGLLAHTLLALNHVEELKTDLYLPRRMS
jgi:hypothetical protein